MYLANDTIFIKGVWSHTWVVIIHFIFGLYRLHLALHFKGVKSPAEGIERRVIRSVKGTGNNIL